MYIKISNIYYKKRYLIKTSIFGTSNKKIYYKKRCPKKHVTKFFFKPLYYENVE